MAANEETVVDAGKLDYAALRSMLEGGSAVETPEIVPDATVDAVAATETPATEEVKTEPASEPEKTQENKEPERDEQGKFKAKDAEDKTPIGVQKRIDKAVKAQREAERRASEAEAKLAQAQGSRPAEQNAPPAAEQQEPKLENFADWDAYQAARIKFLTEREFAAANARQQQIAQQQRQQAESETFQKHWSEQETKARAAKPDFDEVVNAMQWPDPKRAPAVPAIADYLMRSESGALLQYEIGKDSALLERLVSLHPLVAVAELGKLEARITAPATKAAPPPLPKPPAQLGGGSTPREVDLNDPNLKGNDFYRAARKALGIG